MKIRRKVASILALTLLAGATIFAPLKAEAGAVGTITVGYNKLSETNAVINVSTSNVSRTRLPDGNYSTQPSFTYSVSKNGTYEFEGEVVGGDRVLGSVAINDLRQNISITKNKNVTLRLKADDTLSGVTQMRFKNEATGAWSAFEPYALTKDWNVTDGEGLKTVFVQYQDVAGNQSNPQTDKVYLDLNAPTVSFKINNGAGYTKTTGVNLTFNITDTISTIQSILISNDNATWTTIPFTTSTSWTLPATIGNRTVYVKAVDGAGNVSTPVSQTIYYDNVLPTGNIVINNGDTATNSRDVQLNLTFADIHSGVQRVRIYEGAKMYEFPTVPTSPTTIPWTLNLGTTGQVQLEVMDRAGNIYVKNSNVINIITLKITEFKLTNVVNPLVYSDVNPYVPQSWDFPPQPMMSGGQIDFEIYYDLYDQGALSSSSSGEYTLEIIGDNGYYSKINPTFVDRVYIPSKGFKASYVLPYEAPNNSKVYLSSKVNASITTTYSTVTQTAYFPGPDNSTKAQIGYIQGNIKEALRFNEVK